MWHTGGSIVGRQAGLCARCCKLLSNTVVMLYLIWIRIEKSLISSLSFSVRQTLCFCLVAFDECACSWSTAGPHDIRNMGVPKNSKHFAFQILGTWSLSIFCSAHGHSKTYHGTVATHPFCKLNLGNQDLFYGPLRSRLTSITAVWFTHLPNWHSSRGLLVAVLGWPWSGLWIKPRVWQLSDISWKFV